MTIPIQKKGIDVSEHQGNIDWTSVKTAGIDFAIIRAGWTHYEGGLTIDDCFHDNIDRAQSSAIPVGAYVYGYDLSCESARISAEKVIDVLRPYQLEYPVYYDQEYEQRINALSAQTRTDICRTFLDALEQAGYYSAMYASKDWLEHWVYDEQLSHYDKWVAQYAPSCTYLKNYGAWQYGIIGSVGTMQKDYTICGSIPGIKGNCDLDIAYQNYPAIIKTPG
jgi:GH25 family lysozyme M1 (1,4-beta-N-acetylmuramidase)